MRLGFWTSLSRVFIAAITIAIFVSGARSSDGLFAQEDSTIGPSPKKTTEPVFRVSKLNDGDRNIVKPEGGFIPKTVLNENLTAPAPERIADTSSLPKINTMVEPSTPAVADPAPAKLAAVTPARTPHPLDQAVEIANSALAGMRAEVKDYTAILAKREQINGVVGEPSYMNLKVRCPRTQANGSTLPFSIYMKFLRPKACAGREVIWIEGQNQNKLSVHESGGLIGMKTFHLDPNCMLAMRGQRYPIYEAGLENLIVKLIEKAERDRAAGPCDVEYRPGAEINKRSCSVIELVHKERRAPYEFFKAQVFIDDELQLPVRFAAYDWPLAAGAEPKLLEEYTYYNVKINVGLSDKDFSTRNPAYKFPRR